MSVGDKISLRFDDELFAKTLYWTLLSKLNFWPMSGHKPFLEPYLLVATISSTSGAMLISCNSVIGLIVHIQNENIVLLK
jgi:hypothetical protein